MASVNMLIFTHGVFCMSRTKVLKEIGGFAENNFTEDAIEVISEGIKILPEKAVLYYRLTAYLLSSGFESQALTIFQSALELDYEKYSLLFEFMPLSANNESILNLIETLKKTP